MMTLGDCSCPCVAGECFRFKSIAGDGSYEGFLAGFGFAGEAATLKLYRTRSQFVRFNDGPWEFERRRTFNEWTGDISGMSGNDGIADFFTERYAAAHTLVSDTEILGPVEDLGGGVTRQFKAVLLEPLSYSPVSQGGALWASQLNAVNMDGIQFGFHLPFVFDSSGIVFGAEIEGTRAFTFTDIDCFDSTTNFRILHLAGTAVYRLGFERTRVEIKKRCHYCLWRFEQGPSDRYCDVPHGFNEQTVEQDLMLLPYPDSARLISAPGDTSAPACCFPP